MAELSPPLCSDDTKYHALDACKALQSLQHTVAHSTERTAFRQLHVVCVITPPQLSDGKIDTQTVSRGNDGKMGGKFQSAVLMKGVINTPIKSSPNSADTRYPLQIQLCAIDISWSGAKYSTNIISFNAINDNTPGETSWDSLPVVSRSTSRFGTLMLLHLRGKFLLPLGVGV